MAYNTNAPFGLKPLMRADGTPYTDTIRTYPIASGYSTSIFTGDPVAALADGTIGIGVAGSTIRGVFMGVKYYDSLNVFKFSPYWPASTTVYTGTVPEAIVCDDPNVIFTIQETDGSGAAGTPLALADRNLNANFRVGTGSTATGLSGASINNATEAVTSTLNLKIIGLDPHPGNAVGSFANWLVMINNHDYRTGTAGV